MSLITNISQIRGASSINISNTLDNWQPYLDEAEQTFIIPAIGKDFFEEVEAEANSSGSGESGYEQLISRLRSALALYALWLGIDEMSVSVSASGLQVIQSDTHKPAPEYQMLNLKESWLQRAHRNLDLALEYLEDNRDEFGNYVPVSNGTFIASAKEFSEYVDIRGSRRVFLQLLPIMRSIEKKYIRYTLSEDLYEELKDEYDGSGSSEISEDNQALLDLIRPALAHLTMARALEEVSADILNWGSFVFSWSTFKSMIRMDEANSGRISMMLEANQRDGEAELKELQEFLDNNATETLYASYFNSDRYIGPASASRRIDFENSADKSIFVP